MKNTTQNRNIFKKRFKIINRSLLSQHISELRKTFWLFRKDFFFLSIPSSLKGLVHFTISSLLRHNILSECQYHHPAIAGVRGKVLALRKTANFMDKIISHLRKGGKKQTNDHFS